LWNCLIYDHRTTDLASLNKLLELQPRLESCNWLTIALILIVSLNIFSPSLEKMYLILQGGDSRFDVSSLSRSDSASSTQSMQHGGMPELLLGLAYNGTTGRLSVEVIKGSNFRNMAMNRAPGN